MIIKHGVLELIPIYYRNETYYHRMFEFRRNEI